MPGWPRDRREEISHGRFGAVSSDNLFTWGAAMLAAALLIFGNAVTKQALGEPGWGEGNGDRGLRLMRNSGECRPKNLHPIQKRRS